MLGKKRRSSPSPPRAVKTDKALALLVRDLGPLQGPQPLVDGILLVRPKLWQVFIVEQDPAAILVLAAVAAWTRVNPDNTEIIW